MSGYSTWIQYCCSGWSSRSQSVCQRTPNYPPHPRAMRRRFNDVELRQPVSVAFGVSVQYLCHRRRLHTIRQVVVGWQLTRDGIRAVITPLPRYFRGKRSLLYQKTEKRSITSAQQNYQYSYNQTCTKSAKSDSLYVSITLYLILNIRNKINHIIDQRLHACIRATRGHFEYSPWHKLRKTLLTVINVP